MFDITLLRRAFADKLLATADHDAAFVKAVWVAYQMGVHEAGGEVSDKFKQEYLGETECLTSSK